jgi:hypothetical protein
MITISDKPVQSENGVSFKSGNLDILSQEEED